MTGFTKIEWLGIVLIYLGFFGLIGGTVFVTESAVPLWALLLTHYLSLKGNNKVDNAQKESE